MAHLQPEPSHPKIAKLRRRGFMLVLSSPSGAGKTTLTRLLLQAPGLDLTLSISVTTRQRRSSEADGVHYHFITQKEFERLRQNDQLLEWAEVHGNFYGSPREKVDEVLASGRDMLFDIDYQGAMQVREKAPNDFVSVFILPPSMRELRARLERRAEDSAQTIARRLANARNEIARWRQYDYVLVNEDIQESYEALLAIIASERLRKSRMEAGIEEFVAILDDEKITT